VTTIIVEDVAVVTVIVLFAWLVPARRNGIPGLGGRGRVPAHRAPRHGPARRAAAQGPGWSAATATRPEPIGPRPVPAAERAGAADAAQESKAGQAGQAGQAGRQGERDREQDERVLAELDQTWEAGYADRVAAQLRGKGRR
jgi:hypothetical protein